MEMQWLGKAKQRSVPSIEENGRLLSSRKPCELLPGLPNDLAMEVFLRLPAEAHATAMAANRLWFILLASRRYYVQRRLHFPYPSIILCRILDRPPHQGSYSVCEFLDLDLSFPSALPRPIATRAFLRLLPPVPCSIQNITHRRVSPSIHASHSSGTSILLVNEGQLHRWMHFNMMSLKLDYFPLRQFMHASDGVLTFMGSLGPQIFLFQKGTCWSYNCFHHVWTAHDGLDKNFVPDGRCRFGSQGQIFVRDVRKAIVYAFDGSTNEWNVDMQMTQRLANWSCIVISEGSEYPSAFVVATPSATLITAFENFFVREKVIVEYQKAGTMEWCHFLEIKRGSGTRFYLLNKGGQVFLIVTDERSSFRQEIHHCEQFVLTCVFVPFCLFINPFLFDG
ncbi:hypothetical protein GOP47_0014211 [Adiantum capillus-veneris]|uniref:F-box domain-containing protein n=1 Tax=Adiantum capillus-veneris TaxID=13818 RepID=A0A9D4UQB3_ADICA|nr:hypothetical protein GOP47_0014211 [Adiantum capillus-veneris]